MDLDKIYTEFRAFRARVEPMLNEYEEHKRRNRDDRDPAPEMTQELRDEIYKPLDKSEPAVVLEPESDEALRARIIEAVGDTVPPEDKAKVEAASGVDLDALAAKYSVRRIGVPVEG